MTPRYELVDHTADLAVRVRGRDLAELYRNLAWSVCDLYADASRVAGTGVAIPLHLAAPDREALAVTLANELIFRRDAEGLLLPELDVERVTGHELHAVARGERADPRHELRAGLKAATWHELAIRSRDGQLELFLVFDV